MHFNRLRLQGFKSFVEPTDLEIAPGLTGIVGPNGCGKSNLVEALRWVMGENSPKSMRGAEMDDVIFGGTATRPSRNLAEVMLELDNRARTATAEFNHDEILQVTRQIERGEGSDYKVNGKHVRRRDVQLLFADHATGSHSTNLVGQGQIDALIRAKPQDRRAILEEASGTSGLHARRHEAELKLRAAEQNLTRVDDVLASYDTQLRSLKNQVKQASRYRNLAETIRRTEAALLQLRWAEAGKNAENAGQALQNAASRVAELLLVVTQGHTARAENAAELPGLRQAEAAAAAIVQKLTLAREQIDAETKRIADEIRANESRLTQTRADCEREQTRMRDGEEAVARLQAETTQLETASDGITEALPQATQALAEFSQEVEALDTALSQLMQETAAAEARRNALQKEINDLAQRRASVQQKRENLDAQRASLAHEATQRPDLALTASLVEATETELARKQAQAQAAEHYYREAEGIHQQARDLAQHAKTSVTKLQVEYEALSRLIGPMDDRAEKIIDLISVAPGFEHALAVALGESLTAGLDSAAAQYWRALDNLADAPDLPAGVAAFAQYVQAPAALARCLSQIGLAENAEDGARAAETLRPGQIIVSRDGWAWRWDGFTLTPQAQTSSAQRLQQRNRMTALTALIDEAAAEAYKAQTALDQSNEFLGQRQSEDRTSRDALKLAFAALNDARSTYAKQEKETTAITARLETVTQQLTGLHEDFEALRQRLIEVEAEYACLPNTEVARLQVNENRTKLAELRSAQSLKQNDVSRLQRERDICAARQTAVGKDIAAWQARLENAGQQVDTLGVRIEELEAELTQLRSRPLQLTAQRDALLGDLATAEENRRQAADAVIAAEQRLTGIEQQVRRDEAQLNDTRETRVRAESDVQNADEQFNLLRARMQEKLDCGPDDLAAIAGCGDNEPLPEAPDLEQNLARYLRERENMGPVNLRAEMEAEAMQAQIDNLTTEKDDLCAAIAKLRQGIGHLNQEARERLGGAFSMVNERFQTLFQKLFNGGKAHLELVDNEDPMNAGLEIFASPPGKKMQILSLLSGGERTLTALALLFAVFQTNPSPICVLDEAEAALDESNIGRFCELVESIARETGTRFLVITHQRLTMARMDRLYGVTMGEKGVSQLVSVDLDAAVAIRDGSKAEEALREVRAA